MSVLRIPMWQAAELVTMAQVLDAVGDNDYCWHLEEIDGTGSLPGGQSMQVFADAVRQSPVEMSWTELLHLADSLEQTWDCTLVALDRGMENASPRNTGRRRPEALLTVEAVDSSEWIVRASDAAVLRRISARLDSQHIASHLAPPG